VEIVLDGEVSNLDESKASTVQESFQSTGCIEIVMARRIEMVPASASQPGLPTFNVGERQDQPAFISEHPLDLQKLVHGVGEMLQNVPHGYQIVCTIRYPEVGQRTDEHGKAEPIPSLLGRRLRDLCPRNLPPPLLNT
jgi:hypothetical protein